MAIGRTNVGGSGGSGDTLTVTAPVGVTVTVSKDGKTKTKIADSSGKAVFNGLKSGTWTVSISNGSQTADKTVNVVTDYAVAMAFFSATIKVAYPSGSTLTCTDGTTILTATTTTGSYTFTVPNTGTWTVKSVSGSNSASKSVSITSDGQSASVELSYVTYLYNNGDACTGTGGAWVGRGMYIDSSATQKNVPTITMGGSSMTISQKAVCGGACYKQYKIDLTNATYIHIRLYVPKAVTRSDYARLQVWSSFGDDSWTGYVSSTSIGNNTGNRDVTLDVTALSGTYYVGIYVYSELSISVYQIEIG